MEHYRCRCGQSWTWGSMPPDPALRCSSCQRKLEWVPDPPMPPTRGSGDADRGDTLRLKDLPRDRFGNITTVC